MITGRELWEMGVQSARQQYQPHGLQEQAERVARSTHMGLAIAAAEAAVTAYKENDAASAYFDLLATVAHFRAAEKEGQ